MTPEIEHLATQLCEEIAALPLDEKVETLNQVSKQLHQVSPRFQEPVDLQVLLESLEVPITNNGYESRGKPDARN